MRLFHLSDQKLQRLEPVAGATRNGGVDPDAAGAPVVWFTNSETMRRQDAQGGTTRYQHEIEIQDDDPDLRLDEQFEAQSKQLAESFRAKVGMRWYSYPRAVDVIKVREWDADARRYV